MRKLFKHNFVPEVELTTENIDGKRYYVLPTGEKFRSVTTVLGDKLDKTALLEWKKKVGEEQAQKISTQAARRGTAVHTLCEKYVLNEQEYLKDALPSNIDSFNGIRSLLDKHVDNILGVELPLHSVALKTAGRCDLIAEFDGVPSIIDFKTSRKPKREDWIESYFLQTTVYSMMFEWMYKIKIPQIAILIAVDHDDPQLFVKDRSYYVNRVLEIFGD
jgi:ATP-dependent exoDNAse (exonuclease V) beta subunit